MMTHSPDSHFPSPSAADALPWWWRHEDEAGAEISQERLEFPSRSEAETWLGEHFDDLADDGVGSVTLFEGDREVYGPMSLAPE